MILMPASLAGRVAIRIGLVAAASLIGLAILLLWRFQAAVDNLQERSLFGQARDVAAGVKWVHGDFQVNLSRLLEEAYASRAYDRAYAVVRPDGTVVASSHLVLGPFAPLAQEYFTGSDDGPIPRFIGRTYRFSIDGHRFWVQVGQGPDHPDVLLDDAIDEVADAGFWILLVILGTILVVNYLTIRRGLRPVQDVATAAAEIAPSSLRVRLSEKGLPREVQPMVHAFNSALERLDRGFQFQREFIADAAHELRTPLAVLSAHVEAMADPAVRAELGDDIERMRRLIDQLLRSAEAELLAVEHADVADIGGVCREAAALLAPLAIRQGRSVAVDGPDAPIMVMGNAAALGHAVRNLIENALKHTPRGTEVEIEYREDGSVTVRDRGPGVPKESRELIFRRFWRADRRSEGAGLGLAIVARITEAHGGRVEVGDAPAGGAAFTLRLRRAEAVRAL